MPGLIARDRVQRGTHLNNNTLAANRAFIMNYYRASAGRENIWDIYYYFLDERALNRKYARSIPCVVSGRVHSLDTKNAS
jgi:hypothetical protein